MSMLMFMFMFMFMSMFTQFPHHPTTLFKCLNSCMVLSVRYSPDNLKRVFYLILSD